MSDEILLGKYDTNIGLLQTTHNHRGQAQSFPIRTRSLLARSMEKMLPVGKALHRKKTLDRRHVLPVLFKLMC